MYTHKTMVLRNPIRSDKSLEWRVDVLELAICSYWSGVSNCLSIC